MIIDMIAELGCKSWTKKSVRAYALEWLGEIETQIIDDMVSGLIDEDYKRFKKGCMDYMEAYGYKGCIIYNRFKRMPLKEIKAMLNN